MRNSSKGAIGVVLAGCRRLWLIGHNLRENAVKGRKGRKGRNPVSESMQSSGLHPSKLGDVHNMAVAALTVGTGLGAHFASDHAPWVASAGVLSMALLNRRVYGGEVSRIAAELRDVNQRIADISRQMDEQRRETRQGLYRIAAISHEIRSPLSAVISLGEMLEKAPLSEDHQGLVKDLLDSSRMVMGAVRDSLDYSRVESGSFTPVVSPFSLSGLLARVRRQAEVLAAAKPRVHIDMLPNLVDRIRSDEAHLQQVLINLCTNAVKFTEEGRILLSVEASPHPNGDSRINLTFKVKDAGPGLTVAQRKALFQPYSQVADDGVRRAEGSGLGLYISRRIVELMGGSIGVDSAPGQGSEFWFTIPAEVVDAHAASTADPAQPPASDRRLGGLIVGIVDDARINREATRRIVHANGGRCVAFHSAESLLSAASSGDLIADVLLMDIEMPGIGGLEAARELRKQARYSSLPILAVSASNSEPIDNSVRLGELNGFLAKPFHADELVQSILNQRRH